MTPRYFTPDEANALLPEVREAAETLVGHRRAMIEATAKRAHLASQIAGNGGDFDPQEPRELEEELEREAEALDRGLVDFPALRQNGEEVLLCWQVGEDAIAFWHGVEEGFAGRKPLPFD